MYKYSIIIIIKNTKKYLSKCLESVVNQTFRDFEIIKKAGNVLSFLHTFPAT